VEPTPRREIVPVDRVSPVDVIAGASDLVMEAASGLARRAEPMVRPAVRWALNPPVLPPNLRPGGWLGALGRRGAARRLPVQRQVAVLLDRLVPMVVEEVLDRLDLTAVVLRRVDLDALIRAVLERIDLAALAEEVVEAVDLPEIIRESTGSMASDTVRGARMRGIAADEVVGRVRSRLLPRLDRGSAARTVPDPSNGVSR